MVGLHYLRYIFDLSDESMVWAYIENPYFCGEKVFQYNFPIDMIYQQVQESIQKDAFFTLFYTVRRAFGSLDGRCNDRKIKVDSSIEKILL